MQIIDFSKHVHVGSGSYVSEPRKALYEEGRTRQRLGARCQTGMHAPPLCTPAKLNITITVFILETVQSILSLNDGYLLHAPSAVS